MRINFFQWRSIFLLWIPTAFPYSHHHRNHRNIVILNLASCAFVGFVVHALIENIRMHYVTAFPLRESAATSKSFLIYSTATENLIWQSLFSITPNYVGEKLAAQFETYLSTLLLERLLHSKEYFHILYRKCKHVIFVLLCLYPSFLCKLHVANFLSMRMACLKFCWCDILQDGSLSKLVERRTGFIMLWVWHTHTEMTYTPEMHEY